MTKFDKIRDLHSFFLKKFRPKKKIILRFHKDMIYNGSYSYRYDRHYITLNSKDNLIVLCDSWCHEMAHVLDRNKYGKNHHSNHWGQCFAKAYRTYLEWSNLA